MFTSSQKGIVHLGLLILLLLGLVAGVYLVQHPQIFKSKAYQGSQISPVYEGNSSSANFFHSTYGTIKGQVKVISNGFTYAKVDVLLCQVDLTRWGSDCRYLSLMRDAFSNENQTFEYSFTDLTEKEYVIEANTLFLVTAGRYWVAASQADVDCSDSEAFAESFCKVKNGDNQNLTTNLIPPSPFPTYGYR